MKSINNSNEISPANDPATTILEKWKVQHGQVWEAGSHRIMCGDSTSAPDVFRLLGDDIPLLMVTDPPYGVQYSPQWRVKVFGEQKAIGSGVTNDHLIDWTAAFRFFRGDVAYVWHASKFTSDVQRQLMSIGFEIRSQIIWAKHHFAISRGHYHWKHETCWYAVRKGATAKWIGDRKQSTVWEIRSLNAFGRSEARVFHSTQKPEECMARPIRNHDTPVVYDPFCGSGTTLVSCEKNGRSGRGMEISPLNVAVTLDRLVSLGLKPTLCRVKGIISREKEKFIYSIDIKTRLDIAEFKTRKLAEDFGILDMSMKDVFALMKWYFLEFEGDSRK